MAIDPLTATSVLLKGLSTFGDVMSLRGQANALDLQASMSGVQQRSLIQQGNLSADQIDKTGVRIIGSQMLAYAKAGVKFSGSPSEVFLETAKNIRQDIIMTRLNAASRASDVGFDALQKKIAAGRARTKSIQTIGKGLLDIGSTLALEKYKGEVAKDIELSGSDK